MSKRLEPRENIGAYGFGLYQSEIEEYLASDDEWAALQAVDRPLADSPSIKPSILISGTAWRGPRASPSGDAAALVPANRWDVDLGWFEHTTPNKRFGSFIDQAEMFDNVFFGISAQEASAMDAQQRLALEGSYEALGASLRAQSLEADAKQQVAVAVGISYNEYYLNSVHQGMTAYTATSGTLSVVCGRISFTLGLKGPSISIDTACSSSLVGAHLAATSFIPGGCPRALVCGVNLTIRAETTAVLSKAGMLTADGRCKTLDASANGYMRGEACVVHLLEVASEDDYDFLGQTTRAPVAVLAGTGVNQDGRASSLTAPNGPAQQAVIRAALSATAGTVLPYQISVLEMHGTGTALGDPIEVGAAFAVLQAKEGLPLALQAAKSRVLHTEPAAGAVGLASLMQRLAQNGKHETLHLRHVNPHVSSIFSSQSGKTESRGWAISRQSAAPVQPSNITRGSVSSFAYQGTNSHAIVTLSSAAPPITAAAASTPWRRTKMWFQTTCHPLLVRFIKRSNELRLEAPLGRASLSYLLDHSVLDRHVAPSSLFLEGASAAGNLLVAATGEQGLHTVAVADAAFPAALQLGPATQAQHVVCLVDAVSGAVAISTQGPGKFIPVYHMTSNFHYVPQESISERQHKDNKATVQKIKATKKNASMLVPLTAVTSNTAFASILSHQQRHTGYWLHPTIMEGSHQLSLALKAAPGIAALAAAVELCSVAAATLSALEEVCTIGCTLSDDHEASSWLHATQETAHFALSGAQFSSLPSWASLPTPLAPAPMAMALPTTSLQAHSAASLSNTPFIVSKLSEVVAEVLGESIPPDQPLMAAGLDSVGAVELKNAVTSAFGLELPSTVTFDYPSVQALAGYIAQNALNTQQKTVSGPTPVALEATKQALLDIAAEVLGANVLADQPLMEAGLDSVGAVELRNAVQSAFGVELPATVTFDYPTVDALTGFISSSSSSLSTSAAGSQLVTDSATLYSVPMKYELMSHKGVPLSAVTGWAGVAASSQEFATQSLAERFYSAADLIRPVPLGRWDLELVSSAGTDIQGSGSLRMAAWAENVDSFDESIFRLSKSEAVGMDPQCRILLEQTWESLEDGGVMTNPTLWASTGVYVGIVWTEYQVLQESLHLAPSTASLTGSGLNFSVGRVSYTFGLQGPCVGMDTACSSSLVAIHMAHRGLHDGETSAALAAGTNFMLVASTTVHLAQLGSLSSNGRSKTFDASADGYGRGEACIAMVLQRAGDAVDAPHAVLHGSAYNQDGRSSGLTAPNGPTQTALVRTAMATASCSPDAVKLVSMHGTGTPLGDPIEVNALGQAVAAQQWHHLTLVSAKACFGHTEGTAGIHGALAAILSLQRQEAPPVMHTRSLNPYVSSALHDWRDKHHVQAQISRGASSWTFGAPGSLAGCSSFGMSGTNAHGIFAVTDTFSLHERHPPKLSWQRNRHWPIFPANNMLATALYDRTTSTCRFQVPIAAPQLAFLLDHIIQNTPIMPGAGMLETAAAACTALRDSDSNSKRLLCLTGAAIPAPVVLQVGSKTTLECHVNCSTGDLQLRSARGAAYQVHFRTSASSLAPLAVLADEHNNTKAPANSVFGALVLKSRNTKPSIRCTALVNTPPRGSSAVSGFLGHPAVMDNALQLGPATGDVGKEDEAEVTRVVAGISAFVVSNNGQKMHSASGFVATPTSTERAPMAADGTIFTNHWLLGENSRHSVHVMDLQAKVINLEANSVGDGASASAAAIAEDKTRLMYAVEWQSALHIADVLSLSDSSASSSLRLAEPTYQINVPDASAEATFTFPPSSSTDPAQAATQSCSTQVEFVQSLMQLPGSVPRSKLRLYSHGAQPASKAAHGADAEPLSSATALSMQSFMRVASAEYPAAQWSSLDFQEYQQVPGSSPGDWHRKLAEAAGGTDVYCRVAGSGLWTTPRLLVRSPAPKSSQVSSELAKNLSGSVVITGGMGALGTLMATWLSGLGAPKLWLLGRSGRTSGDPLPLQLYRASGQIVCARGDVSSSEEASDVIERAGASAAEPLRSIMHAGAVLDSKVISNVTSHSIRTEYSGKVFGAQQLLHRSSPAALATFQLFSSLASFSGAAGQATYAAANGVLDAWSHAVQGSGCPAVAVQWGNWGGGGMAVRNKGFIERMEKMGLGIIDPDVGLKVMAQILYETAVPPTVLPVSWKGAVSVGNIFLWDNIIRALPAVPSFLEEFARPAVLEAKQKAASAAAARVKQPAVAVSPAKTAGKRRGGHRRGGAKPVSSSAAAPAAQQQSSTAVLTVILEIITNLGSAASPDQPFVESGIDSLGAVQLRNEIASAFGVELQPTVTFDYPTPSALAKFVASQVAPGVGDVADVAVETEQQQKVESRSGGATQVDVLPDVLSVVENVLGTSVGPEDPLMASGLDSLGAVQLRNAISERFGVELPATAALDFPTGAALAVHIAQSTGAAVSSSGAMTSNELFYYSDSDAGVEGITEIVGLSCIYPGHAVHQGAEGFWQSAVSCEDLPSVIPPGRWDIERQYAPDTAVEKMYVRFAAFLPGVEHFDASLFKIPPAEAAFMDPQGRILLEQTHLALQNSALHTNTSKPLNTGVYVGVMHMEYIQYLAANGTRVTPAVTTGNGMDFLIGRISYTFGLTGPCLSTHTACSSSLVATHLAHTGLLNGEASAAAASGIFMVMYYGTMCGISQLQAFSPVGRCKTFEASGDGYGRGEGCAVVVLRPEMGGSDEAPLAVVVSTVVNQAGRASSLTAPNGPAQSSLIAMALQSCEAVQDDVRLVAVHGTGTPLGDPIETGALGQALSRKGQKGLHCLTIASGKSCYGHTEGAAGLTGALLALQASRHQVAPGIMHLRNINPYVASSFTDWTKTHNLTAQAPRSSAPLPLQHQATQQQYVGTSSFGMSGVNAHALMETPTVGAEGPVSSLNLTDGALSRSNIWALAPTLHFLYRVLSIPGSKLSGGATKSTFIVNLAAPALAFLWDHSVGDKAILPGAAMFEAFLAAGVELQDTIGAANDSVTLTLVDMTIAEPVALVANSPSLLLEIEVSAPTGQVSLTSGSLARRIRHFNASFTAAVDSISLSIAASPSPLTKVLFPASCLAAGAANEENYETNKCIASIMHLHWSAMSGFINHPAIMDASMHLLGGFSSPSAPAPLQVPISASALTSKPQFGTALTSTRDWLYPTAGSAANGSFTCTLSGGAFQLCELQTKAWTPAQVVQKATEMLEFVYETEWQAFSLTESSTALQDGIAAVPWNALRTTSATISTANGLRDLQEMLSNPSNATEINTEIVGTQSCLQTPSGSAASPAGAAAGVSLAALVKAAAMEFSGAAITSTQISVFDNRNTSPNSRISAKSDAFGTSIEAGTVLRSKLLRRSVPIAPSNTHLMPIPRGSLASLKLMPHNKDLPGPGEVQIAVKAVGLNFRDVLNVLGMYPGDPGPPGGDCAGVVIATGKGVNAFKPGDAVFGLAPGCIGATVFAPAALVVKKPEALDFGQAAAAPTIYITVLCALEDLRPGSRVLVHAGTGGVGLAALQLAKALGCNVAATAGAAAKRAYLRNEGVKLAADSRSVNFAETAAVVNEGHAVHDVLNSLTSPGMVAASLSVLSLGGKFTEIGKRDIWSHARVAQERPDLSYRIVAIDFLRPSSLGSKMKQLSTLLSRGTVAPPQVNSFRLGDAGTAFRKYSQAQHIGKLVLEAPASAKTTEAGSVIISGGLGSLGLLTASWLVGQKEKHLVLLGRSGRAKNVPLLHSGACIMMRSCDTAASAATSGCLSSDALHDLPAVHAVYNSGGILADAMFMSQTAESVRKVFAPKLASATSMAAAIGDSPLLHNVLFSSAASLFGAPGQANYAAANAALEGYAAASAAAGLVTAAVQWGAWAAGMATDPVVIQRAKRTGLGLLQPEHGLDGLQSILLNVTNRPVVAAVPVTWSTLLKGNTKDQVPMLFEEFYENETALGGSGVVKNSKDGRTRRSYSKKSGRKAEKKKHSLSAAAAAVANVSRASVVGGVLEAAKRVLGTEIAVDQPLMQAGMDSLGAVELRNALNSSFGVDLPPTVTFDHPTVDALADYLVSILPETVNIGSDMTTADLGAEEIEDEQEGGWKRKARRHRKKKAGISQSSARAAGSLSGASSDMVQIQVRAAVSAVLGHEVSPEEPLMQAGLDSLGAVELRNALNSRFGLELSPTATLDYPTVSALSTHIAAALSHVDNSKQFMATTSASPGGASSLSSYSSFGSYTDIAANMPIVISASSSLLPYSTQSSTNTTTTLAEIDTISQVPLGRWDVDHFSSVSPNAWEPRFGSFVQNAEAYDATAFATSRPEAIYMDPQQRLLMEHTGEVLMHLHTSAKLTTPKGRNQEYGGNKLAVPPRTSVMVGIGTVDYVGMSSQLPLGMYFATGGANSVSAGRLSFTFNLTGSCVSIDTACSSSLVAAHYSVVDLRSHAAHAALAAGVNLTLSPKKAAAFTITGMLTADGRCKTLDAAADGYVRAETCVVHFLEPAYLESSTGTAKSGNVLILGSAVNQDGRSSSLTAPSGPAQQSVLRDAVHAAEMTLSHIGALEMHGTGTALGDPIEVGAALAVLSSSPTMIFTATKSRMGHAETGAGALGILNAASQLGHFMSMPVTHLSQVNPYVEAILQKHSGIVVAPRQMQPRDGEIATGISSFAFQGTNAHVVVGYSPSNNDPESSVPLSTASVTGHLPWRHKRYWYTAVPHPILDTFMHTKSTRVVEIQCNTNCAAAASMHSYGFGNRSVVPASLLAELATAATKVLLSDDVDEVFCVSNVVISSRSVALQTALQCSLNMATGEVAVAPAQLSAAPFLTGIAAKSGRNSMRTENPYKASIGVKSLTECFANLKQWQGPAACTAVLELDANAFFLPTGAFENIAALGATACGSYEAIQTVGCGVITADAGQSTSDSTGRKILVSVGLSETDMQATSAHLQHTYPHTKSNTMHVHQLTYKSVAVPLPKAAFTVGWRRRELGSTAISRAKWMLLSHNDSVSLSSICVPSIKDKVNASSVLYRPESMNLSSSSLTGSELVVSSEVHLHWLMKCSTSDHLLLIGSSTASTNYCYLESLVWAHTARDLANVKSKVSVVTFGQRLDCPLSTSKESEANRYGATAIGVAKARFMEDRPSHGMLLDLDNSFHLPTAAQLQWLLSASGETYAALRSGYLFVERLQTQQTNIESTPRSRRALNLRPELCCVVTGGTKGLGLFFAKQLAKQGCKKLVLTSRSGSLSTEDASVFKALGTSVFVKACDASKLEDCQALATWLRESMPAVQVFAHAAGVLSLYLLPDMTKDAFLASVLPKALGANALAAAGIPVEATLLFSSTAAIWSQAGASHYSAGNVCLNAAAQMWQNAGLPGTAVNFGPFGDDGMAATLGAAMEAVGLKLLSSDAVFTAFKGCGNASQLGWARIDTNRFSKVNTVKGPWPFLEELSLTAEDTPATESTMGHVAAAAASAVAKITTETQPIVSLAALEESVRAIAVEILGDGMLDSQGQFPAGAFDSLSAVELSNKLSDVLEITLPGTLVYDYPSVPAIASYVHSKLAVAKGGAHARQAQETAVAVQAVPPAMPLLSSVDEGSKALALKVSIASKTPEPYMPLNIAAGKDCISVVPFGRWDLDAKPSLTNGSSATARVRFASFLNDVASFDPVAFQLTANEAEVMDPQQRLLLETSYEALQVGATANTGIAETAVYIGIQQMEYGGLAAQHIPTMGAYSATSTPFSVAAGRISFIFGLTGPAVSIDTACSSAMVAAHSAAQHLEKRGGQALSGGVNLILAERTTAAAQIAGMLTINGRCKALDAAADGYVRAEACIVLHLQPCIANDSSSAPVLLLRATFVNQDGRSSSLTAPNGPAQQRVLSGALDAARAMPAEILGLEMHGTGTALGDPIEVGAATEVLIDHNRAWPLRLTAAKSRNGHAEPAAGSIGILQAAVQLTQHSSLAVMHLTKVNPYMTSIYKELSAQSLQLPFAPKQDGPSFAVGTTMGVSSFAFQGTNAHILLSSAESVSTPVDKVEIPRSAWEHKRYWFSHPAAALLDRCSAVARDYSGVMFELDLKKAAVAFLHDHRVRGRAVFPAAAMLELTSAAAKTSLAPLTEEAAIVHSISISAALIIQSDGISSLRCKLNLKNGELVLETGSGAGASEHLKASVGVASRNPKQTKPTKSLQDRMFEAFLRDATKAFSEAVPELFISAKRSSVSAPVATGQLDSSIVLTQGQQPNSYGTHPALLDAMTHVVAAMDLQKNQEEPGTTRVPAAIDVFLGQAENLAPVVSSSCIGAFEGLLADNTAISSFQMASEKPLSRAGAVAGLKGFHAKPVRGDYRRKFKVAGSAVRMITATRILVRSRSASPASPASLASRRNSLSSTRDTVQKVVNSMLHAEVASDQPLMEAGMDSLGAVELRTALNKEFKIELPATVTFDYPTVAALAGFIHSELETTAEQRRETYKSGLMTPQSPSHLSLPGSPSISGMMAAAAARLAPVAALAASSSAAAIESRSKKLDKTSIEAKVSAAVQKLLGAQIAADQPLMEAGMDSLGAVELRTALNTAFNADLPATITFDYPTIAALAAFIAENLEEFQLAPLVIEEPAEVPVMPVSNQPSTSREGVAMPAPVSISTPVSVQQQIPSTAVVGVAGLYPSTDSVVASVAGVEAFAKGLKMSEDLPRRIPLERWDVDQLYSPESSSNGSMYVRLGMFLQNIDAFDPGAFRLTAAEASAMDPQQRLLLEQTSIALASAVSTTGALADTQTGVYVGCMYQEFTQVQFNHGLKINPNVVTGNGISYLVGRLSYTFGLAGPSVSTDTACSSSLVAAHQAHKGLLAGETVAAVAGGVNAMVLSITTSSICGLNALSPVARCKTFDASADGYGRGEGFAVLVLAPWQVAETNGGATAVIRGTAINQDGRSSGLTAPNGPSQTTLIKDVLASAGVKAQDIAYVALHGTGTPLGDPIEVNALGQALRNQSRGTVTLGSVKSCYGHTEGAAGLTGALMAMQAFHHRDAPGIMHLRNMNPYVASALGDWEKRCGIRANVPRQLNAQPFGGATAMTTAGTSSFGMGGTNSHLLLAVPTPKEHHANPSVASEMQRMNLWPAPVPSHFLSTGVALPRTKQAMIAIDLFKPALGFLFDHQVQGHVLLPGAALFDASLGSARVLDKSGSNGAMAMILESSILAPVQLSSQEKAMHLQAEVSLVQGMVTIQSMSANKTSHFTCKLAKLAELGAAVGSVPASKEKKAESLGLLRDEITLSTAFSTGRVVLDRVMDLDGFCLPPAVFDSCLHAGAALAPSGAEVRVPTGAGGVSGLVDQLQKLSQMKEIFVSCSVNGSAGTSDYIAAREVGLQSVLSIQDLAAKPIALKPAAKSEPLFTANKEEHKVEKARPLQYVVQLQANSAAPVLPASSSSSFVDKIALSLATGQQTSRIQVKSLLNTEHSLGSLLAVLQQGAARLPTGSKVGLDTFGAQSSSLASAAAWGMTRVAASEVPSVKWSGVDVATEALPAFSGGALAAADLSGNLANSGTFFRPLLLPVDATVADTISSMSVSINNGRVLITGGLGGKSTAYYF